MLAYFGWHWLGQWDWFGVFQGLVMQTTTNVSRPAPALLRELTFSTAAILLEIAESRSVGG